MANAAAILQRQPAWRSQYVFSLALAAAAMAASCNGESLAISQHGVMALA